MKKYGTISLTHTYNGAVWHIDAEPHVATRIKRLFSRAKKDKGVIQLKDTEEICRDLSWLIERYPMEISENDRRALDTRSESYNRRVESYELVLKGDIAPRNFDVAIPPRQYQAVATELWLQSKGILVADDLGLGKQQPIDANVLTPTGYRKIGELNIGDKVIGSNGKPTTVTGIFPQGIKPSYRIHLNDGTSVEAGPEHLWKILYYKGGRELHGITATTEQIRTGALIETKWPGGIKKMSLGKTYIYIPILSHPVEFEEQGPLPIPPYLLGQLIANGALGGSGISFTVAAYDWQEIKKYIESENVTIGAVHTYGNATKIGIPGICPTIRALNLKCGTYNKRIPPIYLHARIEDRISLLHGLMDGDGSCSLTRSRVIYHTVTKSLADDIQQLIESLGGVAKIRAYNREHENKPTDYQINVRLPQTIKPFSLKRKAERYNPIKRKTPTRRIVKIEYERDVESICIRVDAEDHLYVTEHAILTHNTMIAIAGLADRRLRPALIVVPTHLQYQWESELHRFLPGIVTHIIKKGTPYDVTKGNKNQGKLFNDFPDVFITTYYKLEGWCDHLEPIITTVIFDEIQDLRHDGTGKYRGAMQIARAAEYRIGLSATPIFNYGGEIYNVIQILQHDALGNYEEFTREWCSGVSNGKPIVKEPRVLGSYLRDQGLMVRRTRKDVKKELPPLSRITVHVDSDIEALSTVSDSVAELARIILAQDSNPLAKGSAARELDWKLRQATGVAKAPFVAEFVKMLFDSEEKLILFGWHRSVYDIWLDQLKEFNPVLYTGSETPLQKDRSLKRFLGNESRLMIISVRSGSGLDGLQRVCKTGVVGELDWSPGAHEQGDGRLFRDGQEHPVFMYYTISDYGSDPVIADVLQLKKSQIEGIRNPDGELVQKLQIDPNHIKKLAQHYLDNMH